jgi:hypothetical protein
VLNTGISILYPPCLNFISAHKVRIPAIRTIKVGILMRERERERKEEKREEEG